MANEVTYTGSGGNLRAAEIFNRLLWETLSDLTDLRSLCVKLGDLGGSGSSKLETGTIALDDAMTAANADETTGAGNTALGSGSISLTIAQQIIKYEISDLMQVTGGPGNLGMEQLARGVANAYVLRFTDQVCGVIDGFTATAGTTTIDLTVDDFYAAQFALVQAVVPGPYASVLYTVQYTDFQESLRGEAGAIQFVPATADQLAMSGPGFKGTWNNVAIWASDSVVTANAGADSAGAMFGLGAVAYAEASAGASMPGAIAASVPAGSPVYAEFSRTADPGLSSIIGHAFNAVGMAEDGRGVSIITDR